MKTIYVTDLDGTLLNDKSEISIRSKMLLNELASKGALITFATARTPATVVEIFKGVELNLPGIVMTGAATYDLRKNKYGNMKFLDKEVAVKALEIFSHYDISPFVYSWYPGNILHAFHPDDIREHEKSFYELRRDKRLKQFHIGENPDEWALGHALLIFSIAERKDLEPVTLTLSDAIGYPVSYYNDIISPNHGFIEIFGKDVSKASAILELKKELSAERVVVFGDNLNDIPMFSVADLSVAVENSFPEVKEKADIVIGNNIDDSVMEYIYKDYTERNGMAE